jgi:PIN domain nuclease of toxin-antitoxin system
MNLLLDSHILVWSILEPTKLSPRERDALSDAANTIFFSPVSLSELYHKESKKKLSLPSDFAAAALTQGFAPLPLTSAHAEHLRTLPLIHADPFDRLLAAQSIEDKLVLMTRDRILRQYPLTIF